MRLHRVMSFLGAAGACVLLSSTVSADGNKPVRQVFPPAGDLTAPFCGASIGDITAHVAVDREYITTHAFADGTVKMQVEGYQQDVFTVVATGKTLTVNASGPGVITVSPNGDATFFLQGHTVYLNPPDKGLFLFTGLVQVDTATGSIASNHGNVTDLCALLR